MKTTTKQEAKADGFRQLTIAYNLPAEQWMLDNVLKDMERGHIRVALVQVSDGVQVWKK